MSVSYEEIFKAITTLTEAIATDEGKKIIDELKVKFEIINDNEEWRDIEGYDGDYQISNFGHVRSHKTGKWRSMRVNKGSGGYLYVTLSKNAEQKTYTIHRLVALTFIPKFEMESRQIINKEFAVGSEKRRSGYRLCFGQR